MMLKPPAANMPGMTDTLEFVKNLWGSMNLPGTNLSSMSTPPLSPEDLDKRIADLKAVESWLNMNLTMLRGTIQTMEVQRATLSTLKSMGASMAEAMRQSGVSAEKMSHALRRLLRPAGGCIGAGGAIGFRQGGWRRWNGPARALRPPASIRHKAPRKIRLPRWACRSRWPGGICFRNSSRRQWRRR
jgi:hypothetical protein